MNWKNRIESITLPQEFHILKNMLMSTLNKGDDSRVFGRIYYLQKLGTRLLDILLKSLKNYWSV